MDDVIIYGAGINGTIVKNHYLSEKKQVRFFLETIKSKEELDGIPVKSITEVSIGDIARAKIFVATDSKYWETIRCAIDKFLPEINNDQLFFLSKNEICSYYRNDFPINTRKFLEDAKPTGKDFGVFRGKPIDRYYIENFLEKESKKCFSRGITLEVGETTYTEQYFPKATHKVLNHEDGMDLTIVGTIPENYYDVFICTQTLHQIFDVSTAIKGCYRLLKPGGILLATVCGTITKLANTEEYKHFWGFTELSIERLMRDTFQHVEVSSYGNAMAATAFIQGLAVEEVDNRLLDVYDPDYPVLISIVAKKES